MNTGRTKPKSVLIGVHLWLRSNSWCAAHIVGDNDVPINQDAEEGAGG
jgi:hypothetical protein